jgi:hypothetical protein
MTLCCCHTLGFSPAAVAIHNELCKGGKGFDISSARKAQVDLQSVGTHRNMPWKLTVV